MKVINTYILPGGYSNAYGRLMGALDYNVNFSVLYECQNGIWIVNSMDKGLLEITAEKAQQLINFGNK
jgi:hypothetical protein